MSSINSCEKEKTGSIKVLIELVDENNEKIESFDEGDSVLFMFYLTNNMGREITYERPNAEILQFLEVFKENQDGDYIYIGHPYVYRPPILFIDTLDVNSTVLLGGVPVTDDFHWPDTSHGNYYVGDTLSISIDDQRNHYQSYYVCFLFYHAISENRCNKEPYCE